jgi:hypothetical protein
MRYISSMRTSSTAVLLLLGSAACASAQANNRDNPQQVLLNAAFQDEERGNLERAQLVLFTLANTYTGDPLASRAKIEAGAVLLYREAREQVQAGKVDVAFVTYRTLAQVYPESPLAKQAEAASSALARDSAQSSPPLLRRIDFKGIEPVTTAEILQRFDESELGLAVAKPCDPREVERARAILAQFLAEKGVAGVQVKAEIVAETLQKVRVVFSVVKP